MGQNGIFNIAFDTNYDVDVNATENEVGKKENQSIVPIARRLTWGNRFDFLMSCISLSVGLGNIWRFPYVCYSNGGGVFLIPYLLILFFIGKTFYFLEMILGQFTSKGSMQAIEVIPLLKGVGWGQQVASASIATYYSAIIALTFAYIIQSFSTHLPWSTCENFDEPCFPAEALGPSANDTMGSRSSADLFFNKKILEKKEDISDGVGAPVAQLAFCLLISWICVYFSIVKGIKSSGKVAYVFAILPYIILFLILIRACTLDGAIDGIKYFLYPGSSNWWKLLDLKVWFEATTQCFYSLTIGMGSIIMYSSYNEFDRDIYNDAIIISFMDTITSVLGGFTIFAILGNLARNTNKDISEVVKGSVGLAFITYPEAISKIGTSISNAGYWPQAMAIFFFTMLFTLGVGSAVGLLSNLTTNIKDQFPKLKYWQLALIGSFGGFTCGLIYITHGGIHIIDLVDHFGGQFLLFALATLEIVGVIWIYGLENICWDVEFMLKRKLSPYWRVSWLIVIPIFLLSISFYMAVNMKNPLYEGEKAYPTIALTLGWILFTIGVGQVIIGAVYVTLKNQLKASSILKYLISPNNKWGPANEATRAEWIAFKLHKLDERQQISEKLNHSWIQQKYWLLMGKYS